MPRALRAAVSCQILTEELIDLIYRSILLPILPSSTHAAPHRHEIPLRFTSRVSKILTLKMAIDIFDIQAISI
jgi:hypothetical protein